MPSIKDQTTVEAIAREYCNNGRNKTEALKAIGYSKSYYEGGRSAEVVWGNERVINAIKAIDAKTEAKFEHNRAIAIKLLTDNVSALDAIILAQPMNVAAVTARTGAIRELNAISMLHGSNLVVAAESPVDVPEADLEQIQEQARQATLKLA